MKTPHSSPVLMKFGGTSVEDARAFERVARIVCGRRRERPVVVVSAMSGTTDALLACAEAARQARLTEARQALEGQLARHSRVALELLSVERERDFSSALEGALGELEGLLRTVAGANGDYPALKDLIVSFGERLSAALLTSVLCERGLPARYFDARRFIVTNKEHGRAEPFLEETYGRLRAGLLAPVSDGAVPVLGGFIGSHADGTTTTLGRNGSDFTAALVGAALDAREIEIWTDVDGVLSADPRLVARARHVPSLTYAQAEELARFGAKVIYPKTIRPAADKLIPIRIRNSRSPETPGTLVRAGTNEAACEVKVISHRPRVTALRVGAAPACDPERLLPAVLDALKRHHAEAALVTSSEACVTLLLEEASVPAALLEELERLGPVRVEVGRALVCVMGAELHAVGRVAACALDKLCRAEDVLMSRGAAVCHPLLLVEERHAHEAVRLLHEHLFEAEEVHAAHGMS